MRLKTTTETHEKEMLKTHNYKTFSKLQVRDAYLLQKMQNNHKDMKLPSIVSKQLQKM